MLEDGQRRRPGPRPGQRLRPVRPTQHQGQRGTRPFTWKVGPDVRTHDQYVAWLRARCQARFRGEGWELEFEDYQRLWGDDWERRGRTRDTLCLSRDDYDQPWSVDNCTLRTRREHNMHQRAQQQRS